MNSCFMAVGVQISMMIISFTTSQRSGPIKSCSGQTELSVRLGLTLPVQKTEVTEDLYKFKFVINTDGTVAKSS
jgi:hypothetical protein